MLTGKWQAVHIHNPQMDSLVAAQAIFIDTFGKNNDDEANIALYGSANTDSLRESLIAQLNDFKAMQEHSLKTTSFEFKKNGVATMNFSGQLDSSNWYFEDKNELILDEMKLKGTGEKIRMIVKELTDTSLKLQFNEDVTSSTITFHPVKN